MLPPRIAVLVLVVCSQLAWGADDAKVFTSLDENYEARLEQAGAAGYVVSHVFPFVSDVDTNRPNGMPGSGHGVDYSEALMFVLSASSEHLSYKVVSMQQLVGAEKYLNGAGAQGYRVNASDVFMLRKWSWRATLGKYVVVLVHDSSHAYEFRTVDANRRGFGDEVSKAQGEGFGIVQYLSNGIFLLQREKGVKSGTASRFSVVQDEDAHKVQQALNDSGAKGFAARYITPSGSGVVTTVISEQQPARKYEYRVVTSSNLQNLKDGVAEGSKAGFCVVPFGVFATRRKLHTDRGLTLPPDVAVVVMEKRSGAGPCNYDIQVRPTIKETLTAVAELVSRGQQVIGIASTATTQFIVARADH